MDMNVNGILGVSAFDRASGKMRSLTVHKSHISKIEMYRLMRNAEKYNYDDELEHERVEFRNSFETFVFEMKAVIQELSIMNDNEKNLNLNLCDAELKWIEENDKATFSEIEVEFRKVAKYTASFITPALKNLYDKAYALLGDTKFLFEDSRIEALKAHELPKSKEYRYHYYRQHKRIDKKDKPTQMED